MSSLFKKLADMFFRNTNRTSDGFFSGKTKYGDPKKPPEILEKETKQTEKGTQHKHWVLGKRQKYMKTSYELMKFVDEQDLYVVYNYSIFKRGSLNFECL